MDTSSLPKRQASNADAETIVAISTPPGRGGIGVVRLSGPASLFITEKLVRLEKAVEHGRAQLGIVVDPGSSRSARGPVIDHAAMIDQAVVTAFLAPRSYTGEDVVEISAHGSPPILQAIVKEALTWGARVARPGEFTERAFLSGRLDLMQAEAVDDLISAQTVEQARSAAQQMGGALSRQLAPIKDRLLRLIAVLEAGMDFAAGELDDVEASPNDEIAEDLMWIRGALDAILGTFRAGHLLRQGARVALMGPTNAGKSSLFNALLGQERAIVTPTPGTTRDTVEEVFSLDGIPLRLVDTAGFRDEHPDDVELAPDTLNRQNEVGLDLAERLGIARSREVLADADLVLLLHDSTQDVAVSEDVLATSLAGRPHLLILSKGDLLSAGSARGNPAGPWEDAKLVSARSGEGLQALRQCILQQLGWEGGGTAGGGLTTLRHFEAMTQAVGALDAAASACQARIAHEFLLLDLHRALAALDRLTGATTADDILARIFSTFCIGK